MYATYYFETVVHNSQNKTNELWCFRKTNILIKCRVTVKLKRSTEKLADGIYAE